MAGLQEDLENEGISLDTGGSRTRGVKIDFTKVQVPIGADDDDDEDNEGAEENPLDTTTGKGKGKVGSTAAPASVDKSQAGTGSPGKSNTTPAGKN